MTANATRYRPPYVSQILRDPDRIYTDCAAESGIMLAACWTLGEWTRRPDGSMRSLLELSEVLRKRIGDRVGGLTLHDVNDLLHELDPDLPDLPRYPGQDAKTGQSTKGANLRLTWPQVIERLRNDAITVGIILHVDAVDLFAAQLEHHHLNAVIIKIELVVILHVDQSCIVQYQP